MVDYVANGSRTAITLTGIHTLVVQAGPRSVAIRVSDTLGFAACVRVAEVLGHARARANTVQFVADSIDTAGRGIAGSSRTFSSSGDGLFDNDFALCEGIA